MSKARAAEALKDLLESPDERIRLDAAKSLLRAGRGREKRKRDPVELPEGVTRVGTARVYPLAPPPGVIPKYATRDNAKYLLARADEYEAVESLDATILGHLRGEAGTPPTQREVDDHVAYLREEAASIQETLARQ